MYAAAADARAEGDEIAALFEGVAEIEKAHEARYRKPLENVKNGLVFSREGDQLWQCATAAISSSARPHRDSARSAIIRKPFPSEGRELLICSDL